MTPTPTPAHISLYQKILGYLQLAASLGMQIPEAHVQLISDAIEAATLGLQKVTPPAPTLQVVGGTNTDDAKTALQQQFTSQVASSAPAPPSAAPVPVPPQGPVQSPPVPTVVFPLGIDPHGFQRVTDYIQAVETASGLPLNSGDSTVAQQLNVFSAMAQKAWVDTFSAGTPAAGQPLSYWLKVGTAQQANGAD